MHAGPQGRASSYKLQRTPKIRLVLTYIIMEFELCLDFSLCHTMYITSLHHIVFVNLVIMCMDDVLGRGDTWGSEVSASCLFLL